MSLLLRVISIVGILFLLGVLVAGLIAIRFMDDDEHPDRDDLDLRGGPPWRV